MPIEQIYADINAEKITFGPHLIQRMYENGISIEQVLEVILTGTIRKKEPDEITGGKFTKYTIYKGKITVTVKDCRPAFIISISQTRVAEVPDFGGYPTKNGSQGLPLPLTGCGFIFGFRCTDYH